MTIGIAVLKSRELGSPFERRGSQLFWARIKDNTAILRYGVPNVPKSRKTESFTGHPLK